MANSYLNKTFREMEIKNLLHLWVKRSKLGVSINNFGMELILLQIKFIDDDTSDELLIVLCKTSTTILIKNK